MTEARNPWEGRVEWIEKHSIEIWRYKIITVLWIAHLENTADGHDGKYMEGFYLSDSCSVLNDWVRETLNSTALGQCVFYSIMFIYPIYAE